MSELGSSEPEGEGGAAPLNGGFTTAEAELDHLYMVVRTRAKAIARRTLAPETAEDIAQQVGTAFWQAWKATPARFLEGKRLNRWVTTAVRNKIIDRLRVASLKFTEEADDVDADHVLAPEWNIPDRQLEHRELEAVIQGTLATMSRRRRKIFLAVREAGATYESVARAQNTTRDIVRYQFGEALESLERDVARYLGYTPLPKPTPQNRPGDALPVPKPAPMHLEAE